MSRSVEDDATDMRDLLTRALDGEHPVGAFTSGRVEAAHQAGVRRRRAVVGTAAVVAGVLVAVPLALTRQAPEVPAAARPAGSRDARALDVVRDGDQVEASGRVVAGVGGATRFCAPTISPAVAWVPRHWSPQQCPVGIAVSGVDLQTLSLRHEERGMTEGMARLRGVYRGGRLTVTGQSAYAPPVNRVGGTTPPCPTPSGGWTRIGSSIPGTDRLEAFERAHPGVLINRALFRPTPTTTVQVLVVDDPSALRAVLGADAAAFCITRSRFPGAQIDAAWRDAGAVMRVRSQGVYEAVHSSDPDAQVTLVLGAVRVTDELKGLVEGYPPGLVSIDPWLTKVTSGE